jgi:hypothetical protein
LISLEEGRSKLEEGVALQAKGEDVNRKKAAMIKDREERCRRGEGGERERSGW